MPSSGATITLHTPPFLDRFFTVIIARGAPAAVLLLPLIQAGKQVDAFHRCRISRDLPRKVAVSHDLHFDYHSVVFALHWRGLEAASFAALVGVHADDPLAGYHLRRLLNGAKGEAPPLHGAHPTRTLALGYSGQAHALIEAFASG